MTFRDRPRAHVHDADCIAGGRERGDPDPLHVDFATAEAWCAGYDLGFAEAEKRRPSQPLVQATAFGLGIVVGMLLALVLISAAAAAPRSAPDPTAHGPQDVAGIDLASLTAPSTSGRKPSGAPRLGSGAPSSPAVANVATSEGPGSPTTPMPATHA